MPMVEPVPGLVISYAYLWHRERDAGRDEGLKDRPCAIVAAVRKDGLGATRALILPITHRPPDRDSLAMEIPAAVKARLGLDTAPSWIALSEWNDFVWPGPDLRRIPRRNSFSYGMLPPRLFRTVQTRFVELAKEGRSKRVAREE